MLPVETGVVAGQDGALPGKAQGPNVVGVDEADVWPHSLDPFDPFGIHPGLLELVLVVGGEAGDVGALGQVLEELLAAAADEDLVADVVGLVLDALGVQIGAQGLLAAFGVSAQGVKDKLAFLLFGLKPVGGAEVGLVGQPDKKVGGRSGFQFLKEQWLDLGPGSLAEICPAANWFPSLARHQGLGYG